MNAKPKNNVVLEYIWIDVSGKTRSKNKVITIEFDEKLILEEWTFDGSSTGQASGNLSDVVLKPVSIFKNPFINYTDSLLVLCECYNKDGTPHITNSRHRCSITLSSSVNSEALFGIEQEYILFDRNNLPLNWKKHNEPGCGSQNDSVNGSPYYCGSGGDRCFGRKVAEEHLYMCLEAGVKICGTNAEVMASQWEFQIGPLNAVEVSDHLWIARYILDRVTENYDCYASLHPKPYKGDWNGSGCHTNFSTREMRESGGKNKIIEACEKLKKKHKEHIKVYGKYNEERLSGQHETSSINKFSWGMSDRSCSIRIPLIVEKTGCGYLEDRRPASNIDPYLVTEKILSTVVLQ
jgi:glutamine synthetase